MTLRTCFLSLQILVIKIFGQQIPTCHQRDYQIGNMCCPMCPAGFQVNEDCSRFRNTSCLPCTVGTFMNQPTARRQCHICSRCAEASGVTIKRSCTTTSDTVCEPLPQFYCMNSTEESCVEAQKHKSCQPGQLISQKGTASSDTLCSRCPDGTFSDGTLTLCRPHTQCESQNLQLIKEGNAAADAECGEKRSNRTRTLVGAIVFVVILILGAVLFFVYKKRCM
ncbi:hypothetical protein Q5P01_007042 [Channa striata]|uniref:TNFR-Cys domain-containing protein n=1 Tax=Channa striata TaxID=64152 RepID=A0AA88SW00_CHASR|nr:hypothetical protein Q5P01_007042 [Channa striata]